MESHKRIELLVNPDEFFRISDIKRFADDSGLIGYVSAQSGAFGVKRHKFYFDDLARFASRIKQLRTAYSQGARACRLLLRGILSSFLLILWDMFS